MLHLPVMSSNSNRNLPRIIESEASSLGSDDPEDTDDETIVRRPPDRSQDDFSRQMLAQFKAKRKYVNPVADDNLSGLSSEKTPELPSQEVPTIPPTAYVDPNPVPDKNPSSLDVKLLKEAIQELRKLTRTKPKATQNRTKSKPKNLTFSSERVWQIERENQIMLKKILDVQKRPRNPAFVPQPVPPKYTPKSSWRINRVEQQRVIEQDNWGIYKRLQGVKPSPNVVQWRSNGGSSLRTNSRASVASTASKSSER